MLCPGCQAPSDDSAETCRKCGKALFALIDGTLLAGRYEIVQPLGKGGMGLVYKALDRELEELVAVKVLRSDLARSEDLVRRFRSEIRFARKVRHPNVCAIHEYGQDAHLQFIVMEYVEGIDLKQLIRRQGPFSPSEGLIAAIEVGRGLEAVHAVGIVHRDLKTANIMRDSRGLIRLMDFGIAKRFGDDTSMDATATGQVLGTPEYMSPEQARGERVDGRSDIYSFAIVVYELFTGDVPFRGDTPIATLYKHIQEAPPLDGPAASRIPMQVIPVLQRALEKDRSHRFPSVTAMLVELEGVSRHGYGTTRAMAGSTLASHSDTVALPVAGATSVFTEVPTAVPTNPLNPMTATVVALPEASTSVQRERDGWRWRAGKAPKRAVAAGLTLAATIALTWGLSTRPHEQSAPRAGSPAPAGAHPPLTQGASVPSSTLTGTPSSATTSGSAVVLKPRRPQPVARPKALSTLPATPPPDNEQLTPVVPLEPTMDQVGAGTPAPTPSAQIRVQAAPPPSVPAAVTAEPSTPPALVPQGASDVVGPGPGVVAPRILRSVQPQYPLMARRLNRQTTLLVRVLVDDTGRVRQAEIQLGDASGLGFNDAALEAARKTVFRPATRNGTPAAMWTSLPVVFARR